VLVCLAAAPAGAQSPVREIAHKSPVLSLAWSPDGKTLATGSQDGTIRVVELATGKERTALKNDGPVKSLVFSHSGSHLGVKALNGPLSLWEVATAKRTGIIHLGNFQAPYLAFSPDGSRLTAAGVAEHLIWNHTMGGASGSRSGGNFAGAFAAVSPDGRYAAWGRPDGFVQYFDVDARQFRQMQLGPATALAFSPDAKLLAVGARDNSVRLRDYGGNAEVRRLEGLAKPAKELIFSANAKTLAALGEGDPVVRVWDVGTGRLRRQVTGSRDKVEALALAPDGRTLALASGDKVVLWNVALRDVVRPDPPLALGVKELQGLWGALGGADYAAADEAYQRLAMGGDRAVPFLKERLRAVAVPPVDYERIDQLVKDLDAPRFAVRERATAELAKYGELAENALRRFLASNPALEPHRRATQLLAKLTDPPLTPDRLRALEALALLESLGTTAARQALEEMGRDALLPVIRLEAVAALGRLKADKAAK
jgi:hypothetical protein